MPRRTDRNHAETMEVLRRLGYLVEDLSQLGGGVPDLLVGTPWSFLALLEVKCLDGSTHDPRNMLTTQQAAWHMRWAQMRGLAVFVVTGPKDAIDQLNRHRDQHYEDMEKLLDRWRNLK